MHICLPVHSFVLAFSIVCAVALASAEAQKLAPIESYLLEGRLADGAKAMQRLDDQQARFSLGAVQFLQAVESLGQDQFRYGLFAHRNLPLMRLPVGQNESPERISYDKARDLIQSFIDRLKVAEATLSAVDPKDVRLPLKLGAIKLDLNGDGVFSENETMWRIVQSLQPRQEKATQEDFPIVFDAGDVVWLQGYCHAMCAFGEVVLAYDWQDQFERTAHLFYPSVDTPYEFFEAEGSGNLPGRFGAQNLLDGIAWVHTINYELVEPERMSAALVHMEKVVELSRESWRLIEAETDDDREWVPNANQTSVMNGVSVEPETISAWRDFLDVMDLILKGEALVPFWRGMDGGIPLSSKVPRHPGLGINLRKVFTDPQRFDLVLTIQGTALVPYLEKGEIVEPEEWKKMMDNFQGNFFQYFFWFN